MISSTDHLAWVSIFVLVAVVVVYSGKPGGSHIAWAYHVGDQPLFRAFYLIAVMFAAQHSLPVALLAVMLYMLINSMIPVLAQVDETFWNGPLNHSAPPLTDCNAYSKKQVNFTGTPFYPLSPVN